MYKIEYTGSALEDLSSFKKREQQIITAEISTQITWQPTLKTRNRKPLQPNELSQWELRIGKYRVFRDVDTVARVIAIKAIGEKPHNQLHIRRRRFKL